MKTTNAFGPIITLALLIAALTSMPVAAQVPEIPDPNLPDIAMVQAHPLYGAIIIYTPITCRAIGPACGFFRAHEYGHIAMGHQLAHPASYPARREADADCWAAGRARPDEVLAAWQLFMSGRSSANWAVYGNPIQRAERVRFCAIEAGNWTGPM